MGLFIIILAGIMAIMLLLYLACGPTEALIGLVWIVSGSGLIVSGLVGLNLGDFDTIPGFFFILIGVLVTFHGIYHVKKSLAFSRHIKGHHHDRG